MAADAVAGYDKAPATCKRAPGEEDAVAGDGKRTQSNHRQRSVV